MTPPGIPVIDVGALRDGGDAGEVATALHRASQDVGFIYISGHGIAPGLVDAARADALRFFRLPQTRKAEVAVSGSHRGWLATGGAKMHDDAKPDLKESFIWGLTETSPDNHPLRGANRWPADIASMRTHAIDWLDAMQGLALDLMRGFAIGLKLAPDHFVQRCSQPLSRASFVYYPSQPANAAEDQYGVAPHTDFGVLTLLCQDDVGGLEVLDASGAWRAAPPLPGTLVVNVGDLLARWTGNAYRSTPHRVVNRSARERVSLVLAFDPDPDTLIDPRTVIGEDRQDLAEAITCGDYLSWRFGKAFSYRNPP